MKKIEKYPLLFITFFVTTLLISVCLIINFTEPNLTDNNLMLISGKLESIEKIERTGRRGRRIPVVHVKVSDYDITFRITKKTFPLLNAPNTSTHQVNSDIEIVTTKNQFERATNRNRLNKTSNWRSQPEVYAIKIGETNIYNVKDYLRNYEIYRAKDFKSGIIGGVILIVLMYYNTKRA